MRHDGIWTQTDAVLPLRLQWHAAPLTLSPPWHDARGPIGPPRTANRSRLCLAARRQANTISSRGTQGVPARLIR